MGYLEQLIQYYQYSQERTKMTQQQAATGTESAQQPISYPQQQYPQQYPPNQNNQQAQYPQQQQYPQTGAQTTQQQPTSR
jgi:hypothetical protein